MNDSLPEKDDKGRWIKGNSGNAHGKPIGCKNKFGEAFLMDFYEDWKQYGVQVVRTVREEDPVAYMKLAALLVSKIDDHAAKEGGVTVVNVITGVRG